MDAHASAHNHKDFFAFLCHHDDSQPSSSSASSVADIDLLEQSAQLVAMQQAMPNGVDMNMLEGLMALQDGRGQSAAMQGGGGQSQQVPQVLVEQQMRLNQLQQLYQLQTQIFQQQIEILSGQAAFAPLMMDRSRESQQQQQYLPTPAASTELPPQPSPEFVPPMMLQPQGGPSVNHGQNIHGHGQQSYMSQPMMPPAPHSAPANIVFQNIQSPYLPSPADLDFDEMSPLTSPWLGAYNTGQASDQAGSSRGAPPTRQQAPLSGTKRRTQSPGSDDQSMTGRPSRKRQAHVNRLSGMQNGTPPTIPSMSSTRKQSLRGGIKSANSTPLFPAVGSGIASGSGRSGHGGSGRGVPSPNDIPGDTPSPVDLSMPPPAAPQPQASTDIMQGMGSNEPTPAPTPAPEHMMPVTPAIIMKLGRLGTDSSLTPQNAPATGQQTEGTRTRSKSVGRPRSGTVGAGLKSGNASGNLISPALKPIRPAGGASNIMSPISHSSIQPPLAVRKTSHKAAEQKRRDSLKSSFDDLRMLLPPIPLPSEEGYPDEPILPGAMPPRGPPKGNSDGPNRGVSKLQLLRCGNDFIRRLNGRVERRDDEIERLRREVARLRLVAGEQSVAEEVEGEEPIDLEKDLDAVEASLGPLGRSSALADGEDDDYGDS